MMPFYVASPVIMITRASGLASIIISITDKLTIRSRHCIIAKVFNHSGGMMKFRMGGRAVDCDGLAYESARQASAQSSANEW